MVLGGKWVIGVNWVGAGWFAVDSIEGWWVSGRVICEEAGISGSRD